MTESPDIVECWIEASLAVPDSHADAVGNFIIENIAGGLVLEKEDDTTSTVIKFYVPSDKKENFEFLLRGYMDKIKELNQENAPEINTREIKNVEWAEQYKKSVEAVVIGDIMIRPPWREARADLNYDIIIEPKMAFGTGSHETTRMCLKLIREHLKPGDRFLDLGCGSGILSIMADKLDVGYIKAIDHDIAAIENARENFEINTVSKQYDLMFGSIEKCSKDEPFDFLAVNIIKSTILDFIPRLIELTASNGTLIISGLLADDHPEIIGCLKLSDVENYEIIQDNDWFTFIVRKN